VTGDQLFEIIELFHAASPIGRAPASAALAQSFEVLTLQ
jgi:hypothetical protein